MNLLLKAAYAVAILFISSFSGNAQETANGTGRAPADMPSAREQALAAALRDAVRNGAGVDVYSESKTSNFTMDYDTVMTSSFGYVEEYSIISQNVDKASNSYVVEVRAKIGKGMPQMDKLMALRTLVRRKNSPRVLVECRQNINGIENSQKIAQAAIEELALKSGLEIVDKQTLDSAGERNAARDEILNDSKNAAARKAGVSSGYDFIIKATVTGSVGPLEEAYEVKTRSVALGVDMSAVWADTGETIVSLPLDTITVHGKDFYDPVNAPDQMARKYLLKILNGEVPAAKDKNAVTLFRRIIAKWITELDLGAKIKLEFKGIDKNSLDKLAEQLKKTDGIANVWIREFDSKLISSLELESRLDAQQIKDTVQKLNGGSMTCERYTKNYLLFSKPDGILTGIGKAAGSDPGTKTAVIAGGIGLIVIILFIGSILFLLLTGVIVYFVIKKKKTVQNNTLK